MSVAGEGTGRADALRIVRLQAQNVKRLKAVEITPTGDLVVVGGRNEQGKSSVLDAIQYALGGAKTHPREPLRRGTDRGEVVCDLGDLVVRRTFTASGGGAVYVESKDGAQYKSPQAMLDRLVGELTLDPLAFTRMRSDAQAEVVRQIAGLDVSDLDLEYAETFERRTEMNRTVKSLAARLAAAPHHEGAPEAEVSPSEILAEQGAAALENELRAEQRRAAARAAEDAAHATQNEVAASRAVEDLQNRIRELTAQLEGFTKPAHADAIRVRDAAHERAQQMADAAGRLQDLDLTVFRARMDALEAANRKVRENRAHEMLRVELECATAKADAMTSALDAIREARQLRIQEAQLPVPGMGIAEEGFVTIDGIPFDQCSSAQQLSVSVAMALAGNPKLRVLLVRDGSLLDDEHLELLARLAAEQNAQVWLERVDDSARCSVVIEDGMVRDDAAEGGGA